MAGWSSTVPAVIGALVSLWAADTNLGGAGVWVCDGPPVGDVAAAQIVSVGHNGASELAVSGAAVPEGFASAPNREDYIVYCAAAATDGASTSVARTRAYQLFGYAADALAADPTLSGLVLRAMPATVTVNESANSRGVTVNVQFEISVTAYTT